VRKVTEVAPGHPVRLEQKDLKVEREARDLGEKLVPLGLLEKRVKSDHPDLQDTPEDLD